MRNCFDEMKVVFNKYEKIKDMKKDKNSLNNAEIIQKLK